MRNAVHQGRVLINLASVRGSQSHTYMLIATLLSLHLFGFLVRGSVLSSTPPREKDARNGQYLLPALRRLEKEVQASEWWEAALKELDPFAGKADGEEDDLRHRAHSRSSEWLGRRPSLVKLESSDALGSEVPLLEDDASRGRVPSEDCSVSGSLGSRTRSRSSSSAFDPPGFFARAIAQLQHVSRAYAGADERTTRAIRYLAFVRSCELHLLGRLLQENPEAEAFQGHEPPRTLLAHFQELKTCIDHEYTAQKRVASMSESNPSEYVYCKFGPAPETVFDELNMLGCIVENYYLYLVQALRLGLAEHHDAVVLSLHKYQKMVLSLLLLAPAAVDESAVSAT